MRIAVLCNDRIALPAIDQLISAGMVIAIGMPARATEITMIVQQKCAQSRIPFQTFGKKDFHQQLPEWLERYRPDVVLVKTFPYLIPAAALSKPKYGFINFHYAPLPAWRGPSPLFWMIRNRETVGGVTVHRMNESFDEGPILLEQTVYCPSTVTYGMFYTQLAYAGANLTGQLLFGLAQGTLQEKIQDGSRANWWVRPTASDLFIDWETMNADEILALIRACNPWNKGAATKWKGWTFGIVHASIGENEFSDAQPGTILSIEEELIIACKDGKAIKAEIVYCEEGFYPGHQLKTFGLQKNDSLSNLKPIAQHIILQQ